uniref:heat shock 70 kDa protein II-like n=1 Tax=Styela clava TaxID=7725 RepID=UPI00193973EE|nr:heat shock 70 kDa protein II-like [Styela clava]
MSAIGIDLGTTNSCVAVYRNERIEIIANDQGSRVTPSWVSFTDTERLIGAAAKEEASMNHENTLFHIKRLIGRKFNDPSVQNDMKRWSFKVVNVGGQPKIQVTFKEETKLFRPEQISAMILTELKEAAEAYMGTQITEAVITVPAYFNDAQRTATRDAGRIAGLNVLRMINEPTAAAIAYGLEVKLEKKRNVLIFDLGGGTFDVTVVTIENQIFDVKATGGDTHLGGGDFDNRLLEHFIEEFNTKHKVDITKNSRAVSRLKVACEPAKMKLSVSTNAKVQVDGLYNGLDFKSNITRAKFEELNSDFFDKTISVVEKVLADAKMKKDVIDDIVLAGGSTRIPKIRSLLKDFFGGKEISRTINPDEAVAYGAAVLAENIRTGKDNTQERFRLQDVIPFSIGTDVRGTDMRVIIPKNTKIPTKQMNVFSTASDNQTAVLFGVFEGENPKVKDNHQLGSFLLTGISPKPAGEAPILSVFAIDSSGVLQVIALDLASGNTKDITITNDDRRLAEKEINDMIAAAEKMKVGDNTAKERDSAINKLEELVYKVNQLVESDSATISPRERRGLLAKSKEVFDFAKSNENADIGVIRKKTSELETYFNKVREYSEYLKSPEGILTILADDNKTGYIPAIDF